MSQSRHWLTSIWLAGLLLLTGCSTFDISIEQPGGGDPSGPPATGLPVTTTPTPVEAAPTVTPAPSPHPSQTPAPTPTPLPSPTPLPTPTPLTPRVITFAAERVETGEGEGVSLAWEAVGEQVTICPQIGETSVSCRCLFDVPPAGSRVIEPLDIVGAYTSFELAVEANGVRTVEYAPFQVQCPDRFPDWYFDDPPGICPEDAPLSSYAAAQSFEHGRMIWVEASDTYYVFLNHDENVSDREQGWSILTSLRIIEGPLALKPGASPDNRVAETPPDGLFEPVSGFGLIWRGEVVGMEDLRRLLGWAVEPEYGFDTIRQCETSCDTSWDCYLQGPEGEILHLYWLLHFGHYWEVN